MLGKVGAKLTLEQGKESARLVGINILSTVRNALGSLDRSSGSSRRSAWSTRRRTSWIIRR